jgi:hypothetical protein
MQGAIISILLTIYTIIATAFSTAFRMAAFYFLETYGLFAFPNICINFFDNQIMI